MGNEHTDRSGEFPLADGCHLHYEERGALNPGIPLIFCYGYLCTILHWKYQVEFFGKTRPSFRTLWFDYRGHGRSRPPRSVSELTVLQFAKDLQEFVSFLGIEKAVFLGHSMGVNVVLEAYRLNPESFGAMVLSNGTPARPLETLFGINASEKAFDLLSWMNRSKPELLKKLWSLQKDSLVAQTIVGLGGFNLSMASLDDVRKYVNQVADSDPEIFVHLMNDYAQIDHTAWLHKISVPTLILAGEKDFVTPLSRQQLLHELIPESELEVIRRGSHCPQMDQPELANLRIEKFLRERGIFREGR